MVASSEMIIMMMNFFFRSLLWECEREGIERALKTWVVLKAWADAGEGERERARACLGGNENHLSHGCLLGFIWAIQMYLWYILDIFSKTILCYYIDINLQYNYINFNTKNLIKVYKLTIFYKKCFVWVHIKELSIWFVEMFHEVNLRRKLSNV